MTVCHLNADGLDHFYNLLYSQHPLESISVNIVYQNKQNTL